MCALGANRLDNVRFLVDHGSDLEAPDASGKTALHHASNLGIAQFLVERGAVLDPRDLQGRTPLRDRISSHPETARFLFEKGADPDLAGHDGLTPRMRAASEGGPWPTMFDR